MDGPPSGLINAQCFGFAIGAPRVAQRGGPPVRRFHGKAAACRHGVPLGDAWCSWRKARNAGRGRLTGDNATCHRAVHRGHECRRIAAAERRCGMNASTPLTVERAAAWWARRSGTPRPHRATLIRWATRGIRGHRLRAECVGGRWYVTEAALVEFHQRLNEPREKQVDRSAGPTRIAAIAEAQRRLEEITGLVEREAVA